MYDFIQFVNFEISLLTSVEAGAALIVGVDEHCASCQAFCKTLTLILIVLTSLTEKVYFIVCILHNQTSTTFNWKASWKHFNQPAAGMLSMWPKAIVMQQHCSFIRITKCASQLKLDFLFLRKVERQSEEGITQLQTWFSLQSLWSVHGTSTERKKCRKCESNCVTTFYFSRINSLRN